jgi:hypothetical protein
MLTTMIILPFKTGSGQNIVKTPKKAAFLQTSPARELLTPREVRDVERMCNFSYYGALQQYKQKAYSEPAV